MLGLSPTDCSVTYLERISAEVRSPLVLVERNSVSLVRPRDSGQQGTYTVWIQTKERSKGAVGC